MTFNTSRRYFLKSSLLLTIFALIRPEKALASFYTEQKPSGRLNLYNIHTGEKIDTTYRDEKGRCNPQAIEEINWLLRCHHTNEQHPIDIKTLEYLDQVSTKLCCGKEIHIISGYRSPTYNNILVNRGRRVAKNSLHLEGRALDICIPGTSLFDLYHTAVSLRIGGAGYYPRQDFVHIDSGVFRAW